LNDAVHIVHLNGWASSVTPDTRTAGSNGWLANTDARVSAVAARPVDGSGREGGEAGDGGRGGGASGRRRRAGVDDGKASNRSDTPRQQGAMRERKNMYVAGTTNRSGRRNSENTPRNETASTVDSV